jgi:hypothetical protein
VAEDVIFLDPPPNSWRSRKISIRPARWYVVVELDRDGYVDTHGAETAALPAGIVEAADRLRSAAMDRIYLDGHTGNFSWGSGDRTITLFMPFPYVDDAVHALRAAEEDRDGSRLDDLASQLALPIDDWLSPGERQLRRGVDFDARPHTFLRFLRAKAHQQGLRLNGRATPSGVWIRPQLSRIEQLSRAAFPEQYADRPDRWSSTPRTDGPWRPLEDRIRDHDRSADVTPVVFRQVKARPTMDCPCGFRDAFAEFGIGRHEAQHELWSIGLPIPKNITWEHGNIAMVTPQSSVTWRRLVAKIALAPKRENGYDFTTWEARDRPKPSPTNRRAYLLRFQRYIIGYLVAEDRDQHQRWTLDPDDPYTGDDSTTRPSIDLIWTAAVHRGKAVGSALVQTLADSAECPLTELSWSTPLSPAGQRLARRVSPNGIWVH